MPCLSKTSRVQPETTKIERLDNRNNIPSQETVEQSIYTSSEVDDVFQDRTCGNWTNRFYAAISSCVILWTCGACSCEQDDEVTQSKKRPIFNSNRVGNVPESATSTEVDQDTEWQHLGLASPSPSIDIATKQNVELGRPSSADPNKDTEIAKLSTGNLENSPPVQKQTEGIPIHDANLASESQESIDDIKLDQAAQSSQQVDVGSDSNVVVEDVIPQKHRNGSPTTGLVRTKRISIDDAMDLLKLPRVRRYQDNSSAVKSPMDFVGEVGNFLVKLGGQDPSPQFILTTTPKFGVMLGARRSLNDGITMPTSSIKFILPSMGVDSDILPKHTGLSGAPELKLPKLTPARVPLHGSDSNMASPAAMKLKAPLPPILPKRSRTKNRVGSESALRHMPSRVKRKPIQTLTPIKPTLVGSAMIQNEDHRPSAMNLIGSTEDKPHAASDSSVLSRFPTADETSENELQFVHINGGLTGWNWNALSLLVNDTHQPTVEPAVPKTSSFNDAGTSSGQLGAQTAAREDISSVNSTQNFSVEGASLLPRRPKLARLPALPTKQPAANLGSPSQPSHPERCSTSEDEAPTTSATVKDLLPIKSTSGSTDSDLKAVSKRIKSKKSADQKLKKSAVSKTRTDSDLLKVSKNKKVAQDKVKRVKSSQAHSSKNSQSKKSDKGSRQKSKKFVEGKVSKGQKKSTDEPAAKKLEKLPLQPDNSDGFPVQNYAITQMVDVVLTKPNDLTTSQPGTSNEAISDGSTKAKTPSARKSTKSVAKPKQHAYSVSCFKSFKEESDTVDEVPVTISTPVLPRKKSILMSEERKLENKSCNSSMRRSVRFALAELPEVETSSDESNNEENTTDLESESITQDTNRSNAVGDNLEMPNNVSRQVPHPDTGWNIKSPRKMSMAAITLTTMEKENLARKRTGLQAQIALLKETADDWEKWYAKRNKDIKIKKKELKKCNGNEKKNMKEELSEQKDNLMKMAAADKKWYKQRIRVLKCREKEIRKGEKAPAKRM